MILLVLGLLLWSVSHLFKRIAPAFRAGMGEKGKMFVSIASFIGIVLMVFGYKQAAVVMVWPEMPGVRHLNNLLMLVSIYLFAAAGMKLRVARMYRHPMLAGVIVWGIAHLLVNGDVASIVLFGGMIVWAVLSIILINRAEPDWSRPALAPYGKEVGGIVGAVLVLGVIGFIHGLVGPNPFG